MQGDSPAALQIRGPAASSDPFCDAAKSRTSVAGAKFGTQDWPRMASTRSRSAVCGVSILGWIWFSFPRLWGGGILPLAFPGGLLLCPPPPVMSPLLGACRGWHRPGSGGRRGGAVAPPPYKRQRTRCWDHLWPTAPSRGWPSGRWPSPAPYVRSPPRAFRKAKGNPWEGGGPAQRPDKSQAAAFSSQTQDPPIDLHALSDLVKARWRVCVCVYVGQQVFYGPF